MARIQPNTTPDTKSRQLLAGVKQMPGGTPNMFTTMAQPYVMTLFLALIASLH